MKKKAIYIYDQAAKFKGVKYQLSHVYKNCKEAINDEINHRVIFTFSDNSAIIVCMIKNKAATVKYAHKLKVIPAPKKFFDFWEKNSLKDALKSNAQLINHIVNQRALKDAKLIRKADFNQPSNKALLMELGNFRHSILESCESIKKELVPVNQQALNELDSHLKSYIKISNDIHNRVRISKLAQLPR